MKKAKFWISQVIMVAIVSLVLGSPALADKPIDNQAECEASGGAWVNKQCYKTNSSTNSKAKKDNNGKGKGSSSSSDTSTTDGGSTTTDGVCPDGFVWLDLYQFCIAY